MKKWDLPKRQGGFNRDGHEEYPKMLYKGRPNPLSNKFEVAIAEDVLSIDRTRVILSAEQFNSSCQMTVNDEAEYRRARDNGWRDSYAEALALHDGLELDIAKAAAERAYQDKNMGERAKAELAKVEERTGAEHVLSVPETPIKRGRPRKVAATQGGV